MNAAKPDPIPEDALVKIAQSVHRLKQVVPALLELAALEATVKRGRYEALLRNGFTEAQALELVKHWSGV